LNVRTDRNIGQSLASQDTESIDDLIDISPEYSDFAEKTATSPDELFDQAG
jgi:hypothetical protein